MNVDQSSTAPREAGSPYADPDADLVLQSSDGVNFRAHRLILVKCSPVFADILSMPSGNTSSPATMAIAETERATRFLLDFCYWRLPSALYPEKAAESLESTMDGLKVALYLSDKYQIEEMRKLALHALTALARSAPVPVYALAWTHRARTVALRAERASLAQPALEEIPNLPEFDDIPGTAVHRLLQYQKECRN